MKQRITLIISAICILWSLCGCNSNFISLSKGETILVRCGNGAYEPVSDEESQKMRELLGGIYTAEGKQSYSVYTGGFYSESVSFKCGDLIFMPSQDDENKILCNEKYKNISSDEKYELHQIFKNHGNQLLPF